MDTFNFQASEYLAQVSDSATGITVGTLLSNNRPSLIGMSLARYSRSASTMKDLVEDLVSADTGAKLENIAINYGHASVAGMAHTNIFVEDASILDELVFFYRNYLVDGQGRSARYQDYSKAKYLAVPSTQGSDKVRALYKRIITKSLQDYTETLAPTKEYLRGMFGDVPERALDSRTLDCIKYFLPLGLKTSYGGVISARELSNRYVSYLLGTNDPVGKRIGQLILDLMTKSRDGYTPEVANLLRHSEARLRTTPLLVEYVANNLQSVSTTSSSFKLMAPEENLVAYESNCDEALLSNITALINPLLLDSVNGTDDLYQALGSILFSHHTHHNEMGNEAQSGSISVKGMADVGSIKDLLRHRSLRRFVPLLHEECSVIKELDRAESSCFYLPPYIEGKLLRDYSTRLVSTYELIKEWYSLALADMSIDVVNYYTKRMLPHAHATQYVLSGSISDWSYVTQLRVRNGGHIQYRMIAYEIAQALTKLSPLFGALAAKLPEPLIDSREQFVDRS